jgi:hypothetical protein
MECETYEHNTSERIHIVWIGMISRCYCKSSKHYNRYGGRGIGVCDEWRGSFSTFKKWCTEHGYKHGLQIDRIDNDGNYAPDNCRFVTPRENANNKSNNHIVMYNGEEMSLADLCRTVGVPYARTFQRLKKGMSVEDSIKKPTRYTKYK